MIQHPAPRRRSGLARAVEGPRRAVDKLFRVIPAALDAYFARRLKQHAAGIAYRVLFSLAPLAVVLVWIFGVVLRNESLREDVIDTIVGWLPVTEEGSEAVEDAITGLAGISGVVGAVSIAVFTWAASGMMASLRQGLETALGVDKPRPAAHGKLVDLVLVVGTGVLVLVMIAAAFVAQVITRVAGGVADTLGVGIGVLDEALRVGVPLVLSTVVVTVLYRFVPSRRVGLRDTIAGGITTGVLLIAISAASAWLYDSVANWSTVYGSVTAVFVFLYSVYLYASALLVGAVVADAWSAPPPEGPGTPLKQQIGDAVLGLFVRREPPGVRQDSASDRRIRESTCPIESKPSHRQTPG